MKNIKKIKEQRNIIIKYCEDNNIQMPGYSDKSLYKKLKNKTKIDRKKRDDKGKIRNPILRNKWAEIEECAPILYFQNEQPDLEKLVGLICDYLSITKNNSSTLRKRLLRLVRESGYENHHQYFQNNNDIKIKIGLREKINTEKMECFVGLKTIKEIGEIIESANQELSIKKKAEKFLALLSK